MNRWVPRPDSRIRQPEASERQPDLPEREVRLLDVREESGSVVVALDDGSTLKLAPGSVPAGLPGPGEVLEPAILAELRLAAERKQVARLIFAMLDRRLQPVARIRDKVLEKGYSGAAIEDVLEQMRTQGLYSDRHFAEAYCRECLADRAVGRRYLVNKLREKRVAGDIATAVAGEILDDATERELADRAARARWRKIRGPVDIKAVAKVVRHLQSRGFGPGPANQAARDTKPRAADDIED